MHKNYHIILRGLVLGILRSNVALLSVMNFHFDLLLNFLEQLFNHVLSCPILA